MSSCQKCQSSPLQARIFPAVCEKCPFQKSKDVALIHQKEPATLSICQFCRTSDKRGCCSMFRYFTIFVTVIDWSSIMSLGKVCRCIRGLHGVTFGIGSGAWTPVSSFNYCSTWILESWYGTYISILWTFQKLEVNSPVYSCMSSYVLWNWLPSILWVLCSIGRVSLVSLFDVAVPRILLLLRRSLVFNKDIVLHI